MEGNGYAHTNTHSFCFSSFAIIRLNLASFRASSSSMVDVGGVAAGPLKTKASRAEIRGSLRSMTVISCSILLLRVRNFELLLGLESGCVVPAVSRMLLLVTYA